MGNLLSFLKPKIGDALPDINDLDHKPVDESGTDSEYESCVEDDIFITRSDARHHSSWSSAKELEFDFPKPPTTMKYHYNTAEKLGGVSLPYEEQNSTVVEGSLMEDEGPTSTSSDEGSEEDTEISKRRTKTWNKRVKLSKSKLPDDATAGVEQLRGMVTNPAGGDSQFSNSFSMAWDIDVGQESKKRLKRKLTPKKKPVKEKGPELSGLTNEKLAERKVLDLRRWHCISRPQYKKSCGLSSVVSVWNYLYSTIGTGSLPPISQEEALHCLGFKPPFEDIRFGPFTGNATLMRWFRRLNDHYGVRGRAYYLYKPKGRLRTRTMTDDSALRHLKSGLVDEGMGYIYHCLNHYFCPIGYEDTPLRATQAYFSRNAVVSDQMEGSSDSLSTEAPFTTWVFIGEPSRCHPPIHCKKWDDVLQDLHAESPHYFNIRQTYKGMQERKTKKKGRNLHCIIAFKKLVPLVIRKYRPAALTTGSTKDP